MPSGAANGYRARRTASQSGARRGARQVWVVGDVLDELADLEDRIGSAMIESRNG
ncbi:MULTISPECIES: hypothetical protein [unclassified Rathayibacter]|uniref:hypothetical protein n=1 Tax=unclassified Rathayibacter TaxID=2609250 RepID=UPI0015E31290|nr:MULTISPECIES: hypothetical protein [unclassified Rathayibacter]